MSLSPNDGKKESQDLNNGTQHRSNHKVVLQQKPFMEHPLVRKQSTSLDLTEDQPKPKCNGTVTPELVEMNDGCPKIQTESAHTDVPPFRKQEPPTPKSPSHGTRSPPSTKPPLHRPLAAKSGPQETPSLSTQDSSTGLSSPPAFVERDSPPSYEATVQNRLNGEGPNLTEDKPLMPIYRGHSNKGYQENESPDRIPSDDKDNGNSDSTISSPRNSGEIRVGTIPPSASSCYFQTQTLLPSIHHPCWIFLFTLPYNEFNNGSWNTQKWVMGIPKSHRGAGTELGILAQRSIQSKNQVLTSPTMLHLHFLVWMRKTNTTK